MPSKSNDTSNKEYARNGTNEMMPEAMADAVKNVRPGVRNPVGSKDPMVKNGEEGAD
jgi:hypothetical protein